MRKFAFVLFLFLFIAAVCFPVSSRPMHRRSDGDGRRYHVVSRNHVQYVGRRSDRASRGHSRACSNSRTAVTAEKTELSTDKIADGKTIQK